MTVGPSAPQAHQYRQYEVAYTGYNLALNPVFLARNRKTSKENKSQKQMKKKKVKRIFSCLFGGRRKIKFRRKKLGDKVQAKSCRRKVALSVLLRTRPAHRLSSQHFAAVSTPNTAELVLFVFSVHNHGFCGGPNTFSRKNTSIFMLIGSLSRRKK